MRATNYNRILNVVKDIEYKNSKLPYKIARNIASEINENEKELQKKLTNDEIKDYVINKHKNEFVFTEPGKKTETDPTHDSSIWHNILKKLKDEFETKNKREPTPEEREKLRNEASTIYNDTKKNSNIFKIEKFKKNYKDIYGFEPTDDEIEQHRKYLEEKNEKKLDNALITEQDIKRSRMDENELKKYLEEGNKALQLQVKTLVPLIYSANILGLSNDKNITTKDIVEFTADIEKLNDLSPEEQVEQIKNFSRKILEMKRSFKPKFKTSAEKIKQLKKFKF